MPPIDIALAVGIPFAGLVVWLVMLGRTIGNAEQRLKGVEEALGLRATACEKAENDLDQRMRLVEFQLPALSTKVDHAASGITELKADMRVGFERLEALLNAYMKDSK